MTRRKTVVEDQDDDCYICDGTGHVEDCDSRQPAWDIGDLICAYPCDGCCPNGCRPHGLQKMQDDAQRGANALLGRGRR